MSVGGAPRAKFSDEELRHMTPEELRRQLRKMEQDRLASMMEQSKMMKDVNRRMQVHLLEIRGLKDVNQRLQEDNQELRDLCCFLDDDRQKGRKLAREWQRFGRYTSGVMRSEVTTYQQKLGELEARQEKLMKENLQLKELCLFLDQERDPSGPGAQRGIADRDQGDGSSSSSPTAEKPPVGVQVAAGTATSLGQSYVDGIAPLSSSTGGSARRMTNETDDARVSQRVLINEQTLQYIRKLEEKVARLETYSVTPAQRGDKSDKEVGKMEYSKFFPDPQPYSSAPHKTASKLEGSQHNTRPKEHREQSIYGSSKSTLRHEETTSPLPGSKPEAVVHAMKVLEVHEQLEKPKADVYEEEELDENEKAIVRQMCNVVWRKLGDASPGHTTPI